MYKYKYFFRIFLLFVEPKRAEWGASCSYFICPHARTHLHLAYTFSASIHVSASICLSVSTVGSASTRRSANTRSFRDLLGRRSVTGCSSLGSEVEPGSERARECVWGGRRGVVWRGEGRSPVLLIGQCLLLRGGRRARGGGLMCPSPFGPCSPETGTWSCGARRGWGGC